MARSPRVSDDDIRQQLADAGEPLTAAQLGVTTARMKTVEDVVQAGNVQTGSRGRPALLFALA